MNMRQPTLTVFFMTLLSSLPGCQVSHLAPIECDLQTTNESYPFCPPYVLIDNDLPVDQAWGEYAASLDVPECSNEAPVLIVDSTSEEIDGADPLSAALEVGLHLLDRSDAGDHLSLIEAFWIAANREGLDTISFDPSVFPVDEPATIELSGNRAFPWNHSVCIDGRNRGVIIRWSSDSANNWSSIWDLSDGSLQVGLTLLNLPREQEVFHSQIAGCRLNTDGTDTFSFEYGRPWAVDVGTDTLFGPGNVVFSRNVGVRIAAPGSRVQGNYFGYDPITDQVLGLDSAFDFRFSADVEDNVIAVEQKIALTSSSTSFGPIAFRRNIIGVNPSGRALGSDLVGFVLEYSSFLLEENIIATLDGAAVSVGNEILVSLRRNRITGCGEGIVFVDEPIVPAPVITEILGTVVWGTCARAGTIEVFSDPGSQGRDYLGTTSCTPDTPWQLDLNASYSVNTTSTLTIDAGNTSAFSEALPFP